MTFQDLEQELPNGFHDAAIREVNFDFVGRSVVVRMELLMGGPDEPDPERYRSGRISVTPAYLFFIEPPDPHYSFVPNGSPMRIDGDSVKVGQHTEVDRLLPTLPQNATTYRFFFEKWNAFFYLAGGDVELAWDDDAAT